MAKECKTDPRVDQYLRDLEPRKRLALVVVRRILHELLPEATETISYGMPCITAHGFKVACFYSFKNHWSFFPMDGGVIEEVGLPKGAISASKGAVQFAYDSKLTSASIRRLVVVRLAQSRHIRNGTRFDFFDNGTVKARGGVKNGELHGSWFWNRRDGSLMRTGQFKNGKPSGEWMTYRRDGSSVSSKRE